MFATCSLTRLLDTSGRGWQSAAGSPSPRVISHIFVEGGHDRNTSGCAPGGVAFIAVAVGCARTEPEPASPSIAQVRQVAYLKAANPDMGDHFACGGSLPGHIGSALAISTDGSTVVVGAPHESSAARGINGNAADNPRNNSGAVYVFVRRGDAWVQQAYVKASNAGQSDL